MRVNRLELDNAVLLMVDMQERLMPVIHDQESIARRASRLLEGCRALSVPVLATEQYRKGLGRTVPRIERLLTMTRPHEKMRFSACVEPVMSELDRLNRAVVIVAGIEAHVCVLQTCLDLLDAGYTVVVARDAVGSRRAEDRNAAFARMNQLGVIPATAESILFEFAREAGTEAFRAIRQIVKGDAEG